MNLEIFSVWSAQRATDMYVHYHSHDYYELVFYCSGNGIAHIDEERYCFETNDFVLIPPYVRHDEIHYEGGKVICICFYCDMELQAAFYSGVENDFKAIIHEILEESLNQSYGYGDMLISLLTTLIIKMIRNKQRIYVSRKNDFKFIINYLSDNYHDKIVLSQLAEQLNISYDYFRHRFKEQTGYSPQQFLLMKRLAAAKEQLITSQLSCTEIAYQCGFSNSAQFSMLFKREFGVAPIEYRKKT